MYLIYTCIMDADTSVHAERTHINTYYIYTHTHAHTYIHMYIHIYIYTSTPPPHKETHHHPLDTPLPQAIPLFCQGLHLPYDGLLSHLNLTTSLILSSKQSHPPPPPSSCSFSPYCCLRHCGKRAKISTANREVAANYFFEASLPSCLVPIPVG